ncbi:hypothetical protein [Eubacterium oxidoreducens]|uniref:Uncharacterized protein n=1 Tax=Eubacterium oxidoreducens TaxID=1732 RepID=A0A1G6ACH0_EUBOX|nr:hypothetical protein [Eubacterium oxidoreducens]SDB05743.1 hypothetical protein SAMN02910417_00389 [Eubacterium oxidoreducens]
MAFILGTILQYAWIVLVIIVIVVFYRKLKKISQHTEEIATILRDKDKKEDL